MTFCKNCGMQLEEGAKFCTNCGAKVAETAPQPPPANQAAEIMAAP
jgi:uncharacterized membrane protein YvbJ